MSVADQLTAAISPHRGAGAADRLCGACVDLLDVDAAAISLIFDGANTGTLGASSTDARGWDELQFILGEGPCLDSVVHRGPIFADDLSDLADTRWPAYARAMLGFDIYSVYAMPVVLGGEYVGALDLYRHQPAMLVGEDLAGALIAARLAEMPLLDLLSQDLRTAISTGDGDGWAELNAFTRVEVSQATGMLVAQLNVTPTEALLRLRAHAYATSRSATEVARDILDNRLRLEVDE